MPRRSDGDAYSPTRQDCGADFKSSGRTSLTDTISYALVPGPARQGDQEARQCRFLVLVGSAGWLSRAAGKPYTTRQLGSPGENARWGSGFNSPWRGGGGPPGLRAPTVAKHLVSAPPTSCHVSSPRLHARVASRAAPALAPPLPHHTRPPLSSARHLLPLALSRCRGLKTVDFWGRRKVRPRALPQPRPRSPFEQPYGHCG